MMGDLPQDDYDGGYHDLLWNGEQIIWLNDRKIWLFDESLNEWKLFEKRLSNTVKRAIILPEIFL